MKDNGKAHSMPPALGIRLFIFTDSETHQMASLTSIGHRLTFPITQRKEKYRN